RRHRRSAGTAAVRSRQRSDRRPHLHAIRLLRQPASGDRPRRRRRAARPPVRGGRIRRGVPLVQPGSEERCRRAERQPGGGDRRPGLLRRARHGACCPAAPHDLGSGVRVRRAGHGTDRRVGRGERRRGRRGPGALPERALRPLSRGQPRGRRDPRVTVSTGCNRTPLGAPRMSVILSTIVWAPVLFALIALFLPERDDEQRTRVRTVALAGAGVSFFVPTFFAILGQIGLGQGGGLASAYQESHTWFWNFLFQAHYDLVADGITLPLLVVVTTVFGCALFHSWKIHERVRLYVILVLLLETAVNGVLCSSDFVLFAFFWGLLLVPMYLLIRIWGGDGARRAAA